MAYESIIYMVQFSVERLKEDAWSTLDQLIILNTSQKQPWAVFRFCSRLKS
jgi:hypothetical protein